MINIYNKELSDLTKEQLICLVQFLLEDTPLADDQEQVNEAINENEELRDFLEVKLINW